MSSLKSKDKRAFEELFGMHTGYVLDFSNNSFAEFVYEEIGIEIYSSPGYEENISKAKKLRQIWDRESDRKVGTLMLALLDYYEDYLLKNYIIGAYERKKIKYLRDVSKQLQSNNNSSIELPIENEHTLVTLYEDIESSLKNDRPELALDRLHTYATKYLRKVCLEHSIKIDDGKGNYYPLHNLAGSLKKKYETGGYAKSEMSLTAIRSSISLFDKFNDVRNNYSYAHDNESLDSAEAKYIVTIMAETLKFIDEVERNRKRLYD